MAGGNLRAVLLSKPRVDGFFACQVVELLGAKPLAPITVPLTAVAGDASAAQVFWYGQATHYFWDDVVKRGAAGAELLVAVRTAVITS